MVVAASVPALLALAAVGPVAAALNQERGLVEYVGLPTISNLVGLAVLAWMVAPHHGRSLREMVRSWWQLDHADEEVPRPVLLWLIIVVTGVIGLSPLRLVLIDAFWAIAPGPAWSVNSPDANEGLLTFSIPAVVIVYQVLVRIPLTVFVEESLFRGWVQDRHGPILSALLFAVYHVGQWWTIAALVPFALTLSFLRVATRSIWAGAILHATGNVVYALTLA